MSEYWALNSEGRLYIPNLTPETIPYDVQDRNYGTFYLTADERITADALPNMLKGSTPYPYGIWYMRNPKQLHAGAMPDPLYWSAPYLPSVWHIDEELERPDFSAPPINDLLGSFANANGLNILAVNRSLQSIGQYSFRNTALEEVTIPSECTYEETSFPDECVVNQE